MYNYLSSFSLLISTVNCLYMGLNSTQDSFLLYKLIPPYSKNITDSGLFRQCRDIIFHHSKDISRVEASCGRPKVRNPACTGHGNGLIGCNNESGKVLKKIYIIDIIFNKTIHFVYNRFFPGLY